MYAQLLYEIISLQNIIMSKKRTLDDVIIGMMIFILKWENISQALSKSVAELSQ
jgi:hypothetical protein